MATIPNTTYRVITGEEISKLPKDVNKCRHCAHAMIYAKLPEKLFGRYEKHYAVIVSARADD